MDAASEAQLVEQAKKHAQSFQLLYEHYFPRVYGYVAYRIPRREDAEDVVSEVFLKMSRALHQFDYRGEGAFAAWLFRIAYNEVQSFYRQQRQPAPLGLDEAAPLHDAAESPDTILLQQEKAQGLRQMVRALSPRREAVVTLKFFAGLRNREIASVLKLDERSVASHLSRALQDLARMLEGAAQHD